MKTLVDHLRSDGEQRPSEAAYTFVQDSGVEDAISRGEIWNRVLSASAQIQCYTSVGDRVLVAYPPGFDFNVSLLGCLHAGVVAVPVYPPTLAQKIDRIEGIVLDARPSLALGARNAEQAASRSALATEELRQLRWVEIEKTSAAGVASRIVDARQLALLQYTSGSTGRPKGVMLTHANLMTNIHAIGQLFEPSREDRAVFWLPPYHDMGLIGAVMSSLVHGVHTTLMSPGSFVRRPRRWLEIISRTSATISGAPNFAYALCASRLGALDIEQLDLRSWRVAFCGAEPVQADVMRHFCERFSDCGFSERAVYPCYGLAEATLMVAGGKRGSGLRTRRVDPRKLESEGRATEPGPSHRGRELVGCGEACANHRVRIVDPNTCQPLPERCVGEIWFAGPSVAAGYWNNPEETHQTFQARLDDDGDRTEYLRTGDLGFQDGGDLFITGRLKDVIIVAGRNLYPEDLEVVASRSHDLLAARRGAAFSVDDGIVLLHEIDHKSNEHDVADVRRAVAVALLAEHGITLHRLLLVRPNSLPVTTSGKVRRAECRDRFLHGSLREGAQQAN